MYQREGSLPPTIYIQIDGGSENANVFFCAIAELFVCKKIAKQIVITRLPVGHTHEDIDAFFGTIWGAFRDKTMLSEQVIIIIFFRVFLFVNVIRVYLKYYFYYCSGHAVADLSHNAGDEKDIYGSL